MKGQLDVSTPEEYLAAVEEDRRADILELHNFIRTTVPELKPHIQLKILAYGSYDLKYASGKVVPWMRIGIASNAQNISLYLTGRVNGVPLVESYKGKVGKASLGKGCIRFKKLSDLNLEVVGDMLRASSTWSPEETVTDQ